jgi:hypothetical protein
MTPISLNTQGFLQPLFAAMITDFLDGVLFSDTDYILRVRECDPGDSTKVVAFICLPKRPIFDTAIREFNYPDFSLLLNRPIQL